MMSRPRNPLTPSSIPLKKADEYDALIPGTKPMTIPHLFATPIASRRDFLRIAGFSLVLDPLA